MKQSKYICGYVKNSNTKAKSWQTQLANAHEPDKSRPIRWQITTEFVPAPPAQLATKECCKFN